MRKRPTIAVVGPGRLGSALAHSLHAAGFPITCIVARSKSLARGRTLARKVGARAGLVGKESISADVIWLCVPDREIAGCAEALARSSQSWGGKVILHSSGALTSDELVSLRKLGAHVASAHPLMTFIGHGDETLKGVAFAVEGDREASHVARVVIRGMGGIAYPIRKKHKAAYHAWGAFASPLLTSLLALSERVARKSGVRPAEARRRMLPILRRTVENYARWGAGAGFSGPLIRGDAAIVQKHLDILRSVPTAEAVYRELTLAAMKNLPVKNRQRMMGILRK